MTNKFRKLIISLIGFPLALACTDESGTRRALSSQGFRDVVITRAAFFSCGQDDASATGFTATNPIGQRVSGTVCCKSYIGNNCTVRF
jgi:hypothetical protein